MILALALFLRLVNIAAQDPLAQFSSGGDSGWYLNYGYGLVSGGQQASWGTIPIDLGHIGTPPLYLIFVGVWAVLLPQAQAVQAIQISQALLNVAACYLLFRLSYQIIGQERAGLLAAFIGAVWPPFVQLPAEVISENLYIPFILLGMVLYILWLQDEERTWRGLMLVAVVFGLATLSRAVSILFPLGLALHLVLFYGRSQWPQALKRGLFLLVIYITVLSTWTVYNLVALNRFVFVSNQFFPILAVGAIGWDDPDKVDAQLGITAEDGAAPLQQEVYAEATAETVAQNPLGYLSRRVGELAYSYLQPYGTVPYGGDSLKDALVNWWQQDRTLHGFTLLLSDETFWPKAVIYLFHYAALLAGALGALWLRQHWRYTAPILGFWAYTTLAHFFLLATPRYIFPATVLLWPLATYAFLAIYDRLRRRNASTTPKGMELVR